MQPVKFKPSSECQNDFTQYTNIKRNQTTPQLLRRIPNVDSFKYLLFLAGSN